MLARILSLLSAPYRAGVEFVDTRPSIASVRQYLNQDELKVDKRGEDFVLLAQIPNTKLDPSLLSVVRPKPGEAPEASQAFMQGMVAGYELCRDKVNRARNSVIARQNRAIRNDRLAAKRASQQARQQQQQQEDAETHDVNGGSLVVEAM